MTSFAIFRVSKLKTAGQVAASSEHMTRSRPTPNADPSRAAENRCVIGTTGMPPADLVEARIESTGRPVRKNGVRAIEVFAGMSPEWAASASEDDLARWTRDTQSWMTDTFGADNLVSLTLHRDETTPHLTGFVVPVDPDTGRLNASRWLDGRDRMADLQTGYAKSVAHLGLQRGLQGSQATHTTVRQHYAAIQAPVGGVVLPEVAKPPRLELDPSGWAGAEHERLVEAVKPQVAKLQGQARAGLLTAKKAKEASATAEKYRAVSERVRQLPLPDVIQALGLRPDPKDKTHQWIDPEKRFRITLNGQKFYDHSAGKGGGGAIDLVMHVLERPYEGAVAWLGGTLGSEKTAQDVAYRALARATDTVAAAQKKQPIFALPTVEPNKAVITKYLTSRGLDAKRIGGFITSKHILSDARGNVGFVMRDAAGTPRGLELKGTGPTPFSGTAPGSDRDATFRIGRLDLASQAGTVVLTESAIDAMSYGQLYPLSDLNAQMRRVIVSTAGTRPILPASLTAAVEGAATVVVAYDNDPPGIKATKALWEFLQSWFKGRLRRHLPTRQDWNDELRLGPAPKAPVQEVIRQAKPPGQGRE